MKKERIYVHCTKKSEYSEVLKYKARNGHVWRQSQKLVLCNNENIREWEKYGNQSVLGIHEEGGYTSLETGHKKGRVISYSEFETSFNRKYSSQPTPSYDRVNPAPPCHETRELYVPKPGPGIIIPVEKADEGLTVVSNENTNKINNLSTSKNNIL